MLCCARILVCTFGLKAKLTCGGCWGEPFQKVAHLEESTMPGQGLLQVPCGVTSVQSLADWVDSWVGPFPIGELSCHLK